MSQSQNRTVNLDVSFLRLLWNTTCPLLAYLSGVYGITGEIDKVDVDEIASVDQGQGFLLIKSHRDKIHRDKKVIQFGEYPYL